MESRPIRRINWRPRANSSLAMSCAFSAGADRRRPAAAASSSNSSCSHPYEFHQLCVALSFDSSPAASTAAGDLAEVAHDLTNSRQLAGVRDGTGAQSVENPGHSASATVRASIDCASSAAAVRTPCQAAAGVCSRHTVLQAGSRAAPRALGQDLASQSSKRSRRATQTRQACRRLGRVGVRACCAAVAGCVVSADSYAHAHYN